MSIGKNIRRIRRERRETQEDLGKAIGLSAMAVSQWENERAIPRMGAVELLSAHWGVPKSAIIDGYQDSASTQTPEPLLTLEERHLIDIYKSLSPIGKARLIGYAEGLMTSYEWEDKEDTKT